MRERAVPAGEPAVPGATPVWDLSYEYSGGQRVRKTWTAYGSTRHTLDVFGSLRLKDVGYDGESSEYERDASQTHVFLAGGARMIYDPALPQPGATPNGQHVLLRMGDMLGSTSVVVDKESSEVVERATYLAHGAIESDYRPERWGASREDQKYTGHEEDVEVGLVYAGARYYQPHLGVWLSPDPLVIAGGGGEMNPYSYIGGRVFQGTDPTGLEYNPEVAHPSHGVPHAGHVDFGEFPQQSVDGGEPLVRILPKPAARTAPSSTSTKSTYPSVPDVSTDPNPAPKEESSQGKPLSAAQLARLAGESMARGTAPGKFITAAEPLFKEGGADLAGLGKGFARAWIEHDVGIITGSTFGPLVNPTTAATAVVGPGGSPGEEMGKLLASPSIMVGQAGLILLSMGGGVGSGARATLAEGAGAAAAEGADPLVKVTRWQAPPSDVLKSGDWVVKGGKNWWTWAMSGKMNPLHPEFHVPYANGRTHWVRRSTLQPPPGAEWLKQFPPWNQFRYFPPSGG